MVREDTPSSDPDGRGPEARNLLNGLADRNERASSAGIARLLSEPTAVAYRLTARTRDKLG